MTNLTLNQQDSNHIRQSIGDLLTQLTVDYQQAKQERHQLAQELVPTEEDFNFLEELELLTSDVRGYASQIQFRGWIENETAAIAHLQNLRLFNIPAIAQFYFDHSQQYPKLKDYIQRLDYLRLLLLEYLQLPMQAKPA